MRNEKLIKVTVVGLIGAVLLLMLWGVSRFNAPDDNVKVATIDPQYGTTTGEILLRKRRPLSKYSGYTPKRLVIKSHGPKVNVYVFDFGKDKVALQKAAIEMIAKGETPPAKGLIFKREQVTQASCRLPWRWHTFFSVYVYCDQVAEVEIRTKY